MTTNDLEDGCCALPETEEDDCCAVPQTAPKAERRLPALCPGCGLRGRRVELITPKSLLRPSALERLVPEETYYFCSQPRCQTVYFSDGSRFGAGELKVPVFQKDLGQDVPVCYCFDWTRRRIAAEIAVTGRSSAADNISRHVQAGRCACEVNNPQGSCCLGNVTMVAQQAIACSREAVARVRPERVSSGAALSGVSTGHGRQSPDLPLVASGVQAREER
jgi:hypothetical protein